MHLLRTQKTRVILKPSKNIGGVPYAPSAKKAEAEDVLKKLLASGVSADDILAKLK